MNIIISNSSELPIYEQISSQIKDAVLSGELKEGEALPSMRLLALELRISIITTKRAYSDLERDGFIETVVGKGSFVASKNLDFLREENLKRIEESLTQATALAKSSGISKEELFEMFKIISEEY